AQGPDPLQQAGGWLVPRAQQPQTPGALGPGGTRLPPAQDAQWLPGGKYYQSPQDVAAKQAAQTPMPAAPPAPPPPAAPSRESPTQASKPQLMDTPSSTQAGMAMIADALVHKGRLV